MRDEKDEKFKNELLQLAYVAAAPENPEKTERNSVWDDFYAYDFDAASDDDTDTNDLGPKIRTLFDDHQFADIFFEFPLEKDDQGRPKRIVAHKVVLSVTSKELFRRFTNEWAQVDVVTIKAYSYSAFRRLFNYIYCDVGDEELLEDRFELYDLIQMKAISAECMMKDLRTFCEKEIEKIIGIHTQPR